jgi:5-bromo-4-chloroindolyl phosphate hydrolysis protein
LLLALGVLLILVGGSMVVEEIEFIQYGVIWSELIQGIFYIIGGGASLFTRMLTKRRHGRFVKYSTILGDNEIISVSSISKSSGVDIKTVRKELQIMIDKGYFGDSAYIDAEIDSLVLSPEAANKVRHFAQEAAKKASECAQQQNSTSENEYINILNELRSLNDDIADESISSKISRIEEIAGKIFRIVDDEPDKLPQIRKFMDYYLPTTLKLLRSYSVLERQGIDGENISAAKADIDRILDTLIKGYEQQLDLLFKSDAIDISSDIDVLETMLRQDGLKDDSSGFGTTAGGV